MYNRKYNQLVIGEEISLEEIAKFAKCNQDNAINHDKFSRDEVLLLEYCDAIEFALNYIYNENAQSSIAKMPNNGYKKAIVDTLIFTMNLNAIKDQSTTHLNIKYQQLPFLGSPWYTPAIIELVFAQMGYRVNIQNNETLRFDTKYELIKSEPLSLRTVADSLNKKIDAIYLDIEEEKE